ncbi:MAG TPA: DUF4012 domain-containing protein [Nitrolancea sp.]
MTRSERTVSRSTTTNEREARSEIDRAATNAPRLRRLLIIVGIIALVLAAARIYLTIEEVAHARSDVRALRQLTQQNPSTISPPELDNAAKRTRDLHGRLQRLNKLTALPFGQRQVVAHLPWIGERYVAGRRLIQVGLELSKVGEQSATLGSAVLNAYKTTGVNATTGQTQPTWLDVLSRNQPAIDQILNEVNAAAQIRQGIDMSVLPSGLKADVTDLDNALNRFNAEGGKPEMQTDLHALMAGLGSDKPARYLVLLQNPAELRPSGGFPGTMGLVTIDHGQLVSYSIFDGHTLTNAYIAQRKSKRPEPWPIDHYFPQDGFLLHDAGWYADFPTAGATIMSMYAETDWPPIDGVIAVDPAAVEDLLQVTGPLDIEIEGEMRHVTADNVYDEIERQRRLIVEGIRPWDKSREVHKEAVATIGEAIIENLKHADRGQMVEAVKLLKRSADIRDIQAYAANPNLQAFFSDRRWCGNLNPDPSTPAVAITFANVALQKTSENMHPSLDFEIGPAVNGRRTVSLTINVDNTGPLNEDPLYSSLQRWWIQVALPPNFTWLAASLPRQPDPAAPNGGSYVVEVDPTIAKQMTVTFSMPDGAAFLLRRQPGLSTAAVQIDLPGCHGNLSASLTRDQIITPALLCQP